MSLLIVMVEVDMLKIDLAVVGVMEIDVVGFDMVMVVDEDYLMNNLVRFHTYNRLNLNHRS